MAGIYLHIPFCKKACHYCNFHFSTSQQLRPALVEALLKEALLQKNYLNEPVETIYFGGGTPSLLTADELQPILRRLRDVFDVRMDAEITLEANPDDISLEKAACWQQAGINRLSIGIQSFFENDLQWMNRAHTAAQARSSVLLSREAGFNNITIDLIYGIPTLSDENWLLNIQTALALNVPHLSCYALTVEPKTALDALIRAKKKEPVDAEKQARHFDILTKELLLAEFDHYEISNFAKPGFRSRHNSSYWQGKYYLGLGPSAHSFNGKSRQWNLANNSLYIKSITAGALPFERETLTAAQQLNEYTMTSLRTMEGTSLVKVTAQWGMAKTGLLLEAAKKHLAAGSLLLEEDMLLLSAKGKFLADGIAADLFQLD